MSRTATYNTTVRWTGEHWGHLVMGNGPEMKFSAPPDAQGHAGVFTPEDAFVAAANTCVMMMFVWATERFKLKLLSYECRTERTKLIELDRTELFTRLLFRPVIRIAAAGELRDNFGRDRMVLRQLATLDLGQQPDRTDGVLVDRVVVIHIKLHLRANAAEVGHEALVAVEPLRALPVDGLELGVLAVQLGQHVAHQRAEGQRGRQRYAERRRVHQVVLPGQEHQALAVGQ